jgi:hypothetical protein
MKEKDKRDVCLLRTIHDDSFYSWCLSTRHGEAQRVTDYNSWMGDVDLSKAYLTESQHEEKLISE